MARLRTIKPEFWTSEQIMSCSPLSRLLFVGIWNFCDDQGIHPVSILSLKAKIFPSDDDVKKEDVSRFLNELIKNNLITQYKSAIDEKDYWIVTGWSKHQKIDHPSNKYPTPDQGIIEIPPRSLPEASPNAIGTLAPDMIRLDMIRSDLNRLDNKLSLPSEQIPRATPEIKKNDDDGFKNNLNKNTTFEKFITKDEKPKSMAELANNFLGVVKKDYKQEMRRLPPEWESIKYECLEEIGFGKQEIMKLFKKDPLPTDAIQRSIFSFSEQLKNPNAKKYSDPLGMLIGTLMNGEEWKYKNLEIPKKDSMQETKMKYEQIEKERKKEKMLKKQREEKYAEENRIKQKQFEQWFSSISEEEKEKIPKTMMSHLQSFRKMEFMSYFENNIMNSDNNNHLNAH